MRTEDSISPTGVNDYDSDEDNDSDLDSVAAGLMDRDGYFVYDVEDDTLAAISEDIDEGNGVDAGIDDIGDTDNMIMSSAAVDG